MAEMDEASKRSESGQGDMNDILCAAVEVCKCLRAVGHPFCLIGGIALQRWGEPRMTVDVDATVLSEFGNEGHVVRQLLKTLRPRIADVVAFSEANRIVLLKTSDNIGVDISLGALPYEKEMIDRSSDWHVTEHGTIVTCSPEDLVILKAFAARPQDWIDVEGVIIRQGARLNRSLVLEELTPLVELKEEPEILDQLQALFDKHDG